MTFLEVIAALAAAGAVGLLWTSLKARETANSAMRAACRDGGFLFLDDTVALEAMRPARDGDGRMTLRRIYAFEYSDTGDNRRKGRVTMMGPRIVTIEMDRRPQAGNGADEDATPTRQPASDA